MHAFTFYIVSLIIIFAISLVAAWEHLTDGYGDAGIILSAIIAVDILLAIMLTMLVAMTGALTY